MVLNRVSATICRNPVMLLTMFFRNLSSLSLILKRVSAIISGNPVLLQTMFLSKLLILGLLSTLHAMGFAGFCRIILKLLVVVFSKAVSLAVWPFAVFHYLLGRFLLICLRATFDEQYFVIYFAKNAKSKCCYWAYCAVDAYLNAFRPDNFYYLERFRGILYLAISAFYSFYTKALSDYFYIKQMVYIVIVSAYGFLGFRESVPLIIFNSLDSNI